MKRKSLVALSGGPDSAVALYEAVKNSEKVMAVSFLYGAVAEKEVEYARRISEKAGVPHRIVDISFLRGILNSSILDEGSDIPKGEYADDVEKAKTTVVPFRNGIMLSILAGMAESMGFNAIVFGAHFSDVWLYPDCREEFSKPMGKAIFEGTGGRVHFHHIFSHYTKAAVFALGQELGVPLSDTWSCYANEDFHCGQCGSCIERQKAFKQAGIEDKTGYAEPWLGLIEE